MVPLQAWTEYRERVTSAQTLSTVQVQGAQDFKVITVLFTTIWLNTYSYLLPKIDKKIIYQTKRKDRIAMINNNNQ